jgi:hypothetical protein
MAVEQRKRRAKCQPVLPPRVLESFVVDVVADEEERLPPVLRCTQIGLAGRHLRGATRGGQCLTDVGGLGRDGNQGPTELGVHLRVVEQ